MHRSLLIQLAQRDTQLLDSLAGDIRMAEDLGIESIWCLPEAGEQGDFRLGAPEFWLAAIASRTERIRLGWGLAGLMPPSAPPIRSAEQAASLDLASKGRLEIAFLPGEGVASGPDVERVGEKAAPWDEALRMLVEMWDQPRFSWTSERFEVPPVDVLPKPVQSPHPPLWFVGWSIAHAELAGRAGLGFLDVSGGLDEALEMHRDVYMASRSEADPVDLVCVSAYAATLAGEPDAIAMNRLEHWESIGFDQAILRVDPAGEGSASTLEKIRRFASDSTGIH